jgi:superfamily II helicase
MASLRAANTTLTVRNRRLNDLVNQQQEDLVQASIDIIITAIEHNETIDGLNEAIETLIKYDVTEVLDDIISSIKNNETEQLITEEIDPEQMNNINQGITNNWKVSLYEIDVYIFLEGQYKS